MKIGDRVRYLRGSGYIDRWFLTGTLVDIVEEPAPPWAPSTRYVVEWDDGRTMRHIPTYIEAAHDTPKPNPLKSNDNRVVLP